MSDDISFLSRLSAAVPADMAEAVRRATEARGLSTSDYVRGATQARLLLDGAPVRLLPNLQRTVSRTGRGRTI